MVSIATLFPIERIRGSGRWQVALCLLVFALSIEYADIHRGAHVPAPFILQPGNDLVALSYFDKPRLSRNPLFNLIRLELADLVVSDALQARMDIEQVPNAVDAAESSAHFTSSPVAEANPAMRGLFSETVVPYIALVPLDQSSRRPGHPGRGLLAARDGASARGRATVMKFRPTSTTSKGKQGR